MGARFNEFILYILFLVQKTNTAVVLQTINLSLFLLLNKLNKVDNYKYMYPKIICTFK